MNTRLVMRLAAVAILAAIATDALAQPGTLRYRQGGPWENVTDGTTPGWGINPDLPGTDVPGLGDIARINWGGATVTLNYDAPEFERLEIGVDESGVLEVQNGGVLTTSQDLVVGNNGFVDATMDVEAGAEVNVGRILWLARGPNVGDTLGFLNILPGGVVNVASHLWWGSTGDAVVEVEGTLNQTGGILGLGSSDFNTTGGSAEVNVRSGGEFNLFNIFGADTRSIQPGSSLNIFGTGRVTVQGDVVGAVGGYRDAGLISGDGVAGAVTIALETAGSVAGDFNEDGVVDIADYTTWRDNVGDIGGLPNDNGLGVVGGLHYDLWVDQFGMTAGVQTVITAGLPPAGLAIPEPTALLVLFGCLAASPVGRRRMV